MTPCPLVVGAGLAGLTVALALAEAHIPVAILSRCLINTGTSSGWAQGGLAAAMGDDDSPSRHAADTIAAGAGLCDPAIVASITAAAPDAVRWLQAQGVAFDSDASGRVKLGLEGAHSCRRIVHAQGDSTGAAIMAALTARARENPAITIIENATVTALQRDATGMTGVWLALANGGARFMAATQIVLATGGVGALWAHTTNPLGSWGQGLALAARVGARLRDIEFVQFHPTAMAVGLDPMPLVSEALRGEGAKLVDENGVEFMAGFPQGALSPRDIVARAIWAQLQAGRRVFLDARGITPFATRFPSINAFCMAAGIDPVTQPIPICPAAHYHMGGVAVDAEGRTSVSGLWACGEVAGTGLHGANRLASNSLLEAVVMGRRVALQAATAGISPEPLGPASPPHPQPLPRGEGSLRGIPEQNSSPLAGEVRWGGAPQAATAGISSVPLSQASPPHPQPLPQGEGSFAAIRAMMSAHVGVLRDRVGLTQAVEALRPLAATSDMALVGWLIATAALRREESRGAHFRTDFPTTAAAWQKHQDMMPQDPPP